MNGVANILWEWKKNNENGEKEAGSGKMRFPLAMGPATAVWLGRNEIHAFLSEEAAVRLSLSVLEKYLARKGFGLEDRCDARTGLVLTRALDPASGAELVYPKPVYLFHSLDREACTQRLLAEVAVLEARVTRFRRFR